MIPPDVTRAYALDREGGERLRWGEIETLVKASGAATGDAFVLFEEREPVDTPLHVHEREDELFFVLEGEHVFQVGQSSATSAARLRELKARTRDEGAAATLGLFQDR